MSLAKYLATLDAAALATVLTRRTDVLVEPVPRDLDELADRLGGVDSLSKAMSVMDADEYAVAVAIAVSGPATAQALAGPLDADAAQVAEVVARLTGRALAWGDGDVVGLPERLADHLAARLRPFRPIAQIAKQARVDDVKLAVHGLGGDVSGTRPALVGRLTALLTDRAVVRRAVAGLSPEADQYLSLLMNGHGSYYLPGGRNTGEQQLLRTGLLVAGQYQRSELPREVAATVVLGGSAGLAGRPDVPPSSDPVDDGRGAADTAVRGYVALLDEAASAPLTALKKGGVGARERKRLATRLGLAEPALLIDIAAAMGLLVPVDGGYAPAAGYAEWREEPVAVRWAGIAQAWFALDVTPTDRTTEDGEVAPPVPLVSTGGLIRRALLRAAAGGGSVTAAAAAIGWFCPVHGYNETGRDRKLAVARQEAELLGIAAGDRLTTLGERLVGSASMCRDEIDVADLLPETRTLLVLQSDLSAVVSGQPSAAAARVLAAAAAPEGHGAAATWRFSPASVRAALDAGWTVESLRAELAAASDRELPQPLDYLLRDVARRHGGVRVREVRCCITGDEAEITEILHTRSLARLDLRRLAPTVLTSPAALDAILTALRKAGFAPMPEDADGTVVLPPSPSGTPRTRARVRARPRVAAADLAARLVVGGPTRSDSDTRLQLTALNPRLDSAEVGLLADALDHGRDVRIRYRNSAGNHTVRDIAPRQLWDRWITAYCYLRSADREFAVHGIETVSPAG